MGWGGRARRLDDTDPLPPARRVASRVETPGLAHPLQGDALARIVHAWPIAARLQRARGRVALSARNDTNALRHAADFASVAGLPGQS